MLRSLSCYTLSKMKLQLKRPLQPLHVIIAVCVGVLALFILGLIINRGNGAVPITPGPTLCPAWLCPAELAQTDTPAWAADPAGAGAASPGQSKTSGPTGGSNPPSGGGGGGGGGGSGAFCGNYPSVPNQGCTGWEHTGVTLHACSLPLTNASYDSCLFTGEVNVSAANITVTRSKIVGIVNYRSSDDGSLRGLWLTDVEIDSSGWTDAAIGNNDYTCIRCDVHGGKRGASLGSNVTLQDSYFHGWYSNPGDHITGASGHGGSNNIVKHNNISCDIVNDASGYACSAALSVYGDDAPGNDNWLITNNLFNSGSSYCVQIVGTPSKPYPNTNITFTDNKFGKVGAQYWSKSDSLCSEFGPITGWTSGSGNVWSGNVDSNGNTVNP